MSLKASRRRFPISHSSQPEREREKKYIQSLSLAGLCLSHRFHNAEIWKGLRCLGEKTHRLTGAGDKNLKAPSKNFYVQIYVPKLKSRFYLIVFKRFTNPLTRPEFHPGVQTNIRVLFFPVIQINNQRKEDQARCHNHCLISKPARKCSGRKRP